MLRSPASPKTTGQGSGSNWTEIDLIKNQDEINKERKIKRQKMKLLYKEIDSGVVSVNIVQELKDVIYYSELYKDTCDKLAHYKEQRRINGYRPRLPCSPGALLAPTPHPHQLPLSSSLLLFCSGRNVWLVDAQVNLPRGSGCHHRI